MDRIILSRQTIFYSLRFASHQLKFAFLSHNQVFYGLYSMSIWALIPSQKFCKGRRLIWKELVKWSTVTLEENSDTGYVELDRIAPQVVIVLNYLCYHEILMGLKKSKTCEIQSWFNKVKVLEAFKKFDVWITSLENVKE